MLPLRFGYKSGVTGMAARSIQAYGGPGRPWTRLPTVLALLVLSACSTVSPPVEQPLRNLTASLRLSHSLEMSRLTYRDACGNPRDFALGPALADAFQETVVGAFQGTTDPAGRGPSTHVDRILEIDAESAELIVFVEPGTSRRYPADVSLGVRVTAYDAVGRLLDRRRLSAKVSGSVYTEGERCLVRGVEQVEVEAVETLADEFGRYLRTSPSIARGTVSPESPEPSVALTFRARLLDGDGDQVLEGEEEITLEVEVTNVGTGPAREVAATVSGSSELVRRLPPVITFGDLQPGESKRETVTTRLGSVAAVGQAELVLSLTSRSPLRQAPASKKFLIMLQPKQTAGRTPRGGLGSGAPRQLLLGGSVPAGNTLTA